MTWRERAVCTQIDPELFFPDLNDAEQVRRAKARCRTCPVLDRCRAEADDIERRSGMGRRWGVWGGSTPAERYAEDRGIDHGTPEMWRAASRVAPMLASAASR